MVTISGRLYTPERRATERSLRLALLIVGLVPTHTVRADDALPPNVLFIVIDDLNDCVGCLAGHPRVRTPHIDRLAAAGTLFTNAHCQAPLCNPSRTSVLTGLRPSTTGVYALDAWFRDNPQYERWVTLPQYFAQHGDYTTSTTGKVFHDAFPPVAGRTDGQEFGVWGYHGKFGPLPAQKFVRTVPRPWLPLLSEVNDPALVDWGVFPAQDSQQDDWQVTDWAISQLDASNHQPFFLSVGIRHPHVPLFASQRWYDLYPAEPALLPKLLANDRSDTPRFSWYLHWNLPEPRLAWLQQHQQEIPMVRGYLASVSFADHLVGRLLDAVERNGLREQTLIVLWSDHGYHLGEKGISGKNSLWERSTRVPLVIAGPGVQSGSVCHQPVELLDLFPTLIELCGLPANPSLEGLSLVPQLRDATTARERPAVTTHGPGNHSVRTTQWRYIRYADGSEELYDHLVDPHEWTNLAGNAAHQATKSELAAYLPPEDAPPLPGAVVRLVQYDGENVYWEGKRIAPDDPVPAVFQTPVYYRTKRIAALVTCLLLMVIGTIYWRRSRSASVCRS